MKRIFCVFLLGLMSSTFVNADIMAHRVWVEDRSSATREEASKAAFEAVLRAHTLITAELPASLERLIPRTSRYLDNYSYGTEDGEVYIDFVFAEVDVVRALEAAEVAVVPPNRPRILVVGAYSDSENGVERDYLGADESTLDIIRDAFGYYEIEVVVPDWDVDDRVTMSIDDAWARDASKAGELARRYRSSCVMMGSSYRDSFSQWRSAWAIDCLGVRANDNSTGEAFRTVIDSARDKSLSIIRSARAVAVGGDRLNYELIVDHVDSYQDYDNLMKYLAQMFQVRQVVVKSIQGDTLTLEVAIVDSQSRWLAQVRQDNMLVRNDEMHFSWGH